MPRFSKVLIIQPPLVQLNTPYPSGAYLSSFFKQNGFDTQWKDLSIELFNTIFCRKGLSRLFNLTRSSAISKIHAAKKSDNKVVAENLERYLCQEELWIEWIDFITNLLKDGKTESCRELCHKFIFSPFSPRGSRMNNYIANLNHELTIDDARSLAVLAIEDLSDYITFVFDKEFSLVRYAESLAVNETSFSDIEKGLDSPIMTEFYHKVLDNLCCDCEAFKDLNSPAALDTSSAFDPKILVCITIPFAGTFPSALYTCRYLKQKYKNRIFITIGGGFVNTELRDCCEISLSNYIDAISYDRGYGSYKAIEDNLQAIINLKNASDSEAVNFNSLYKTALFTEHKIIPAIHENQEYQKYDDHFTASNTPDYSDIDFTQYPRMADTTNPMQRLWSDGAWLKAYMAHGCYWHKCAFCDVTLDYIKSYKMTGISNLYQKLLEQCRNHNIYGIHFVDEAMPPKAMKQFALHNLSDKNLLSWWGNIRFEKTFTRDDADFMSNAGLIGVSGGIEIATGSGLDKITKGTDLQSIVNACCAFKEAGILVHAYMIYGYYGETEQDTINSMEILRQFFSEGLLDSCFWHKFVLTRHSSLYAQWLKGMHRDLEPREPENSGIFAKNGLHFKNENRLEKYGEGLNAALQSWMAGEDISVNVNKWFSFKTPSPTISKSLVKNAIDAYEQKRDALWNSKIDLTKAFWLGGKILQHNNQIFWNYMQESCSTNFSSGIPIKDLSDFIQLLENLSPRKRNSEICQKLENLINKTAALENLLKFMRGRGLVVL